MFTRGAMLRRARDLGTLLAGLDDAIETWIGYAVPPASRVIADSGFTPEPPGDACPRCGSTVGGGEVTESGCGRCRGRRGGPEAVV